ncbi:adenylyltransferase/cytidyltransferase family protein [Flavobacterium qiangtangense]|uniref:Adenylyltransferase/cytidyltransferase family protein n=1 Tax=Flavobacterium qiangtangense TaxID=1442595 RepID=A0ABW1PKP2_9FLAO
MEPKPTIGITFSTFDLLHAGHIRMLADAKTQCDYLIVGLQTDPTIDRPEKNRPTQTLVERYTQLKGCKFVDEIIPYTTEQDLDDILRLFHIDVRIIGEEYREKEFTGKRYCEENRILLIYNSRNHRFSSTGLRREVYENECAKHLKKV